MPDPNATQPDPGPHADPHTHPHRDPANAPEGLGGMAERPSKDLGLETLRGLAILLLVFHHTHDVATPNVIASKSIAAFDQFFQVLRMPLFTAISGYLYAGRPVHVGGSLRPLLQGKLRRVLKPGLVCLTFLLLLGLLGKPYWLHPAPRFDSGILAWLGFYVRRPITYWFLIAIFLVFAFVGTLDKTQLLRRFRGWLAALFVATLVSALLVSKSSVPWFCVGGALYLLPPFLIGLGVRRFIEPALHDRPKLGLATHLLWLPFAATGGYATSLSLQPELALTPPLADWIQSQPFAGFFHWTAPSVRHAIEVVAGCGIVLWLLCHRRKCIVPLLATLGSYAYGIYLFHRIVMWGWDAIVWPAGHNPSNHTAPATYDGPAWPTWIIASMLVLTIAMAIEHTCRHFPFTRQHILGLRPRPRKAGSGVSSD